jgi:hypothetical protein
MASDHDANSAASPAKRRATFMAASRRVPSREPRRKLHVQLLLSSGPQHHALGVGVVARRQVDRRGHVRIHLESGRGYRIGHGVNLQQQVSFFACLVARWKVDRVHDQIQLRIETMYLDKLDGRITQEFFDKQSAAWRSEQDGLQRKIQDVHKGTPAPVDQAVDMLRLTSGASELFLQQPAVKQRRLLQVVVEKAAWQDGALRTTLFEPFEILRHSNQESSRKEKKNGGSGRDLEIWLPKNRGFQLALRCVTC